MAEFEKPASRIEFDQNFKSINPLMNETQAYYESSRCLFCHDAPCITACPTEIDIPLFIRQINTNNINGAATTIYQSNWLGNICGKACPTEVLCEGACVYNLQGVKPIDIGRLQSFATTQVMSQKKHLFSKGDIRAQKVAIVGAGPAGLSAACELSLLGYPVKIFEAKPRPSGLALHGVAPYKITNEEILEEAAYLQDQFDFQIDYEHAIVNPEDFKLLDETYEAILVGIGLSNTAPLKLPGEELEGSWGAIEFIEQLKVKQHQINVPRQVVVIGGGNTAMDAASECARMGAENVTLVYRKGLTEMSAYQFEYELAKSVGVKGLWFANPVAIIGEDHVEGIKLVSTSFAGNELTTVPDSEFIIACDWVIRATGQEDNSSWLSNLPGLKLDHQCRIIPGQLKHQTTNPKYFLAGDAFNGGLEVVNAVAEAKQAAQSIHQYLSNLT